MAPGDIEVRVVGGGDRREGRRDLDRFIRFPWRVYRDLPHWVPPLLRDVRFKLDRARHPFFEHARMELFLATRGAEVVGRIAAIVDDRHNEFHHERTGFFGMFECLDDPAVAARLFAAAEGWCREQGMERIRGPVNLSMNDECGLLVEGADSPPCVMMPYTPLYYLALCEGAGYAKAKDLFAYLKPKVGVEERISRLVERIKRKEGLVIRPLDMKRLKDEVAIIKQLYNDAWELNWGFVPMTDHEMDLMTKELKPLVEPELVLFAEIDGKPVGVNIVLPDINFVLQKLNGRLGPIGILKFLYYRRKVRGLRAIVFGLKKEYRRTGIATAMYFEAEQRGARLGYEWCEMSWNLEDNELINRFDEAIGGKLYKRYRIYEKAI